MSWVRSILAVSFACNVNGIALRARPLLGITLPVSLVNFLLIDDYNMMRNTMSLIGGFRSVLNICTRHIGSLW